jgi:tripartite-type tricarboxylate transporter receptor subunit TctC
MAPPGLPQNVAKTLSDASQKAMADPEFLKLAKKSFTVDTMTPETLKKDVVKTLDDISDLLKKAGEIK